LTKQLEILGFRLGFKRDGSYYLKGAELKIEFLSPERARGSEKAFHIKQLSLRTTPLRFLDIISKDRVVVKEGNLNICIPSPLAFCIHKLLIAQRRQKVDKRQKDIEQAIHVLEVINLGQFKKEYDNMPKKWKKYIMQSLIDAKKQMPLKQNVIDKGLLTLQM